VTKLDKALATQLANIEKQTGKKVGELLNAVPARLKKHGEVRAWLMKRFGLGYGDANTLAYQAAARGDEGSPRGANVLDQLYAGDRAPLRPIHEKVIATLDGWGEFEVAPKKGYVSFRRKKQFAMMGPKSASRVELGINSKAELASDRIKKLKPGGMCQYVVSLQAPKDVTREVVEALRIAFEAAG